MKDQRYQLEATPTYMAYEFTSEGPKGSIPKIIKYTITDNPNVYNLGFGDKIEETDDFDDEIISDNKDSVRVLSTVAASVYIFTDNYPNFSVLATGSTNARTRLYRIGISNNLKEIQEDYLVLGYLDNKWELFEKNKDYSAFLIKRKISVR
jgi:hypothetical protein